MQPGAVDKWLALVYKSRKDLLDAMAGLGLRKRILQEFSP